LREEIEMTKVEHLLRHYFFQANEGDDVVVSKQNAIFHRNKTLQKGVVLKIALIF
jgi:hypothetical protein